jgi:hypothetical protein
MGRHPLLRCLLLGAIALGDAFAQQASESSVKAALVYKFASYVEWPAESFASPETPLAICVVGADDVAADLEPLIRGRTVNNRPFALRRVKEGEGIGGCHVVYVGRREATRINALARAARSQSALLVSDAANGLENGSVINFVPIEDRIGFEVSIDAAERSNLRISSRMLTVARRVVPRSS